MKNIDLFLIFPSLKESEYFKEKCSAFFTGVENFGFHQDNLDGEGGVFVFSYKHQIDCNIQDEELVNKLKSFADAIENAIANYFREKKETFMINKPIAAIHPGSKREIKNIDFQRELKKINQYNFDIVYFSSTDKDNAYIKENPKYDYGYEELLKEGKDDKERFKRFLALLKARAEGKEIEFFDLKKKVDDLYHIFFLKALACHGMLGCMEIDKVQEAKNYYLRSLGNKNFGKVLEELKESDEVKGLEDIKEYKSEIYSDINEKLIALEPQDYKDLTVNNIDKNLLKKYLEWVRGFFDVLEKIKNEEVQPGGEST